MKQLKVGQRIRLEGVVTKDKGGYYDLQCDKCCTHIVINQSEADQCEIIEDVKPEPAKWEPKVGDVVQHYDSLEDQWNDCKIIAFDSGDIWLHNVNYTDMAFRTRLSAIRPIAKPVTAEDELDNMIEASGLHVSVDLKSEILDWLDRQLNLQKSKGAKG